METNEFKECSIEETAKKCNVVFKLPSFVKPGAWVVIGDNSPVKHGMQIKCSIKPCKSMISSISQLGQLIHGFALSMFNTLLTFYLTLQTKTLTWKSFLPTLVVTIIK